MLSRRNRTSRRNPGGKRGTCILIAAAAVAATPSAQAAKRDPNYVYGPAPDWEHFKQLGEAAIRRILIDPESARFEWPLGYRQSGWKPPLARTRHGYTTCGYVNSRNRVGGYVGRTAFVVVIDHDRVVHADVANNSDLDFVRMGCAESARRGMFPPSETMPAASASSPAPSSASTGALKLGFAITPMKQGAYIDSLQSGSAGERAGLKPGMVISHVNGIILAGLGDAMARILEASEGQISLSVIGGGHYVLQPPSATSIPVSGKGSSQ